MPFHIDYTGPANVSAFMRVDKVKPEGLVEAHKKSAMEGEPVVSSVVGGMEVGAEATTDATAPMDTDTPKHEGPTPLTRTSTDLEMYESNTTTTITTSVVPNTDSAKQPPTTTTLSASRTESTIVESQITTSTTSSLSSVDLATPASLLEDADRRFVSSFRGRTIHGLTIDLPQGYGGLVLRREGNDSVKPGADEAPADPSGKGKTKSAANGTSGSAGSRGKRKEQPGTKPQPRRGRLTRSAAISQPNVIAVETNEEEKTAHATPAALDDNADAPVEEDGDALADGEVPDEHPVRRLVPHAQFSSFTLWHQDRPVDKGRDEYYRSLTEWIALSHEVLF